jgi:hypothetical protein
MEIKAINKEIIKFKEVSQVRTYNSNLFKEIKEEI